MVRPYRSALILVAALLVAASWIGNWDSDCKGKTAWSRYHA